MSGGVGKILIGEKHPMNMCALCFVVLELLCDLMDVNLYRVSATA